VGRHDGRDNQGRTAFYFSAGTKQASGIATIVHRCLEKNPEQRFQSAPDLAFVLEALVPGQY
jgi:hypothetical protein